MTYDKIKALETSILEAIAKHDCDPKEASNFAEKCFASHKLRDVNENMIKNLGRQNDALMRDIARHKTCISNLRGYIEYLEKELEDLKNCEE